MSGAIYYYPTGDLGLIKIDLGEEWSDIQEDLGERIMASSGPQDLTPSVVDYGGRTRIRCILERFSDRTLAGRLNSLLAHLKKGLPISIAADTTKTWAGFHTDDTLKAGKKSHIDTNGNFFHVYESVTALTAGDRIIIQSANPERFVEDRAVSAYDTVGRYITLPNDETIENEMTHGPILIRHEHFWPVMYLSPEQRQRNTPILTSDRRLTWNLDLELVEVPDDYVALFQNYSTNSSVLASSRQGGVGFPELAQGGSDTLQGILRSGYGAFRASVNLNTDGGVVPIGGHQLRGTILGD
jgi:hypothetical protein